MRDRAFNRLVAIWILTCGIALAVLTRRDQINAIQQQRARAAVVAGQQDLLKAMQRSVAHLKEMAQRESDRDAEVRARLTEGLRLADALTAIPHNTSPEAAQARISARAAIEANDALFNAALYTMDDQGIILRDRQLDAEEHRLRARVTALRAAATAGFRPLSLVRPWIAAMMFMPLVFWAVRRKRFVRRRRERLLTNRCVACGYDLRATDGRCPECGAEPVDCAEVMKAVVSVR